MVDNIVARVTLSGMLGRVVSKKNPCLDHLLVNFRLRRHTCLLVCSLGDRECKMYLEFFSCWLELKEIV